MYSITDAVITIPIYVSYSVAAALSILVSCLTALYMESIKTDPLISTLTRPTILPNTTVSPEASTNIMLLIACSALINHIELTDEPEILWSYMQL